MKEQSEGVGATEFDYPNSQNPKPHAPIFYGSTPVPHPTNSKAKTTPASEVMRSVLEGK
jgi:hypothetical protein